MMLGLTRERVGGVRWIALAAALVALALLGAVLATAGRPTVQDIPAVAPVPTAAPAYADLFQVRFTYRLPADVPFAAIQTEEGIYRWDTTEQRPDGTGAQGTLVIRTIGQRYVDPCDEGQGIALIRGGPAAAADYLRSIRGLKTTSLPSTTVDGQPASQIVIQLAPTADCPVVWTWPERLVPLNDGLPPDQAIRFTITEVNGRLVAIGAITTAKDMATFAPTADAFIASLRFDANHPEASTEP